MEERKKKRWPVQVGNCPIRRRMSREKRTAWMLLRALQAAGAMGPAE